MTIPRLSARDIMPDALCGGIAALGNFDGFHLGHQAVAGEAIAQAKAAGKPAIIATFDPHPVRYFAPDAAPFRLTTLDQRQRSARFTNPARTGFNSAYRINSRIPFASKCTASNRGDQFTQ